VSFGTRRIGTFATDILSSNMKKFVLSLFFLLTFQWLPAQENTVPAPFTPLIICGDTISLLGRKLQLNRQGFPEQIQTFFTAEMSDYSTTPTNILAENIHFHFTRQSDGKDIRLIGGGLEFTRRQPGIVQWQATSTSDSLRMEVAGTLKFDGSLSYTVKLTALQDLELKEITMHIPFQKEVAKYMMGLGQKGGNRPDSMVAWTWDLSHKNQEWAWIGNLNAGLQWSLRDEKLPSSWRNSGRGGITVGIKGRSLLANNYSGARNMKKGDTLYYNFTLLITPFHALNTDFQSADALNSSIQPFFQNDQFQRLFLNTEFDAMMKGLRFSRS
jgi:Family of unknown function (DUF6067)